MLPPLARRWHDAGSGACLADGACRGNPRAGRAPIALRRTLSQLRRELPAGPAAGARLAGATRRRRRAPRSALGALPDAAGFAAPAGGSRAGSLKLVARRDRTLGRVLPGGLPQRP